MNDSQSIEDEIICDCSGTRKSKIISLIEDRGIRELDRIEDITGACTGCGSCDAEVMGLLKKYSD